MMADSTRVWFKEMYSIAFRDRLAKAMADAEGRTVEYEADRSEERAIWQARATVSIRHFVEFMERTAA